ncbi:MAG: TraR/DksA C4-type zinc finger protein [Desulfomonile tiedjei]|uniref:TraR/DksA C4-type zinc finger protein n=1 Tax=Desulfomonile tiedjei TaxID=2358 RepID=A0A9D6Z6R5_9BACT|nr:TraR/DksA C4-type zinc finger protein [Desulfomonile tiedjei]
MWMTREEISATLGIVPNSVRGKVQKGQIERKVEDGKNLYRIVSAVPKRGISPEEHEPAPVETGPAPQEESRPTSPEPTPVLTAPRIERAPEVVPAFRPVERRPEPEPKRQPTEKGAFNPKQVLLDLLASMKVGRSIDAIEKGDEIDLATGEISRDLDAKISMRKHRQLKEIEDALERIKLGEYGECEDCGEPIPEQRLRLFPAARLCVRCQEELDQYEKLRESQGVRGGTWREEPSEGTYVRTFED